MDFDGLPQDFRNRPAGIQRPKGILKNHLHFLAERLELFPAQGVHAGALEIDFSAGGFQKLKNCPAHGGLTTAAFSDKSQNFFFAQ